MISACILSMAACIKNPHFPEPETPSSGRVINKITEIRFENGVYLKEVTEVDYNSFGRPSLVRTYASSSYTTDTANLVFTYSDSIFYDAQKRVIEAIRYDHMEAPGTKYGRRLTYTGNDTLPTVLAVYDSSGPSQIFTDTVGMIYYPDETLMISYDESYGFDTSHVTYIAGNFSQYGYSIGHSNYDSAVNIERCFNLHHGLVLLLPFQEVRMPVLSLNNWRTTSSTYHHRTLTYDSLGYVQTIHQEKAGKTVRDFHIDYKNP